MNCTPQTNPEFKDESSELLPVVVKDAAWKLDHNLIRSLLTDKDIKSTFFDDIDGHLIFNHNTFIDYISKKNFFANSYTQFRNKIGLNIEGKFLRERGEVSLVWPFKDCVLEGEQTKEEDKRKEIFFNEVLAQDEINCMFDPIVLTNWKRHTASGEEDELVALWKDISENSFLNLYDNVETPQEAIDDFRKSDDLE